MVRLPVLLVCVLCTSCVARWQTVARFSDEAALPNEYVGYSHRVWREGDRILVEIDQVPGIKIAIIEAEIRSDGLYLFPLRASVGSGGKNIVPVEVATEKLPQDWFNKTYWVTSVDPPHRVRANVTAH
jgi:hypothetical protein